MTIQTTESTTQETSIDPLTTVGLLSLTVADLGRSVDYYTKAIGLRVLQRSEDNAVLGVVEHPLLILEEQPNAKPWPRGGRSYTGLYHFAILVPTRADLGRWLRQYLDLGFPPPGEGDHVVSEALYLEDPDSHGIEIYRDRPRDGWVWEDGRVRMGSGPVDTHGMMAEAEQEGKPWAGMPAGTTLGHMHLQVGDIAKAKEFYHDTLGFDIVAGMSSALFLSAGGYHHHIGMNVWHSEGAGQAPADSVRLKFFTIDFPSSTSRDEVIARLDGAGITVRHSDESVSVQDPWGNTIQLRDGA